MLAGRLMAAAGNRGTTDPYWSYVRSLLHFDGTNGSTTLVDQKGLAYTAAGGSALSTATKKFGTAALSMVSGYLQAPSGTSNFGTGDFTFEMWVNLPAADSNPPVYFESRPSAGTNGAYLYIDGGGVYVNSAYLMAWSSAPPKDGNWHHIAYSRKSGHGYLFLDGALSGSGTDGTSYGGSAFEVGYNINGVVTDGFYIDEMRLTVGVGRYTAAFTPPTAPFPNN